MTHLSPTALSADKKQVSQALPGFELAGPGYVSCDDIRVTPPCIATVGDQQKSFPYKVVGERSGVKNGCGPGPFHPLLPLERQLAHGFHQV